MLQGLTPHVALARGGWMLLLYSSKTLGVAPRKSEKQRRPGITLWPARCSQLHGAKLLTFGLPATGPELEPPAREGIGEVASFAAIPYDAFRRGIHAVGSSCSTDLRGAAEAHLVQDPVLLQQPVQARSLQLFVGHEAGASLLHSAWRDTKENREARLFPKHWLLPSLALASGIWL